VIAEAPSRDADDERRTVAAPANRDSTAPSTHAERLAEVPAQPLVGLQRGQALMRTPKD
jgi:hypothetical protein